MSEWKSIETAPRDGTPIIGWDGWGMQIISWSEASVSGRKAWVYGPIQDNYNSREEFEPNLWQPCPPEPTR